MTEGDHTCDLDGCDNEADGAFNEDDGEWPNPPLGWVHAVITRHDAAPVHFEFCSEAHLAAGMAQPLPPAVPLSRLQASRLERVLTPLLFLAFLAVLVLGAVTAAGLLWGAIT